MAPGNVGRRNHSIKKAGGERVTQPDFLTNLQVANERLQLAKKSFRYIPPYIEEIADNRQALIRILKQKENSLEKAEKKAGGTKLYGKAWNEVRDEIVDCRGKIGIIKILLGEKIK
ncbi:MAG TPA: hypothetical protein VFF09_01755 [archaeon]|nr:hypothetical protein [archaeon]